MSGDLVLIVDDDEDIRMFLDVTLNLAGYEVAQAVDGADGVQKALEMHPAIVLMDVMMPRMDGITAIRRLRMDGRTSHLPIIVVTAKAQGDDKISGLAAGADDYITKPFDPDELVARVQSTLRRASEMRTVSPLTGLPGNTRIDQEITRRVDDGKPFALLYADLNHFKAVNDHYGFMRGDDVIRRAAELIVDIANEYGGPDTFVGHIGGDDFVLVVDSEGAEQIAETICTRFDEVAPSFYDESDRTMGGIHVADRQGQMRDYGFVSVSIGVAMSEGRDFTHPSQPVALATEMKSYAKNTSNGESNFAIDRRASDE